MVLRRNGGSNGDQQYAIRSEDGVTWTALQCVPIDPVNSSVDHLIAGMGVGHPILGPANWTRQSMRRSYRRDKNRRRLGGS